MPNNQDDQASKIESATDSPRQTSEFSLRSATVLSASFAALFCTAGFLNAYGVFQTYYTTMYLSNYSEFQISWIGSFSVFAFFGFSPLAGLLTDRIGPTIPICIGAVCQLLAVFMISLCKEYYQFFLAQGVLLGFGMAFITNPTISVNPLYFQRNRALAQGVSIAGSSMGGVIWPIILVQLLSKDGVSFGWSMRILGFIQIPLLAAVILGVRRPLAVKKPSQDLKDTSMTGSNGEKGELIKKESKFAKLGHPTFILLCAGLAIFYFGFFAPFFYVSSYGIALGISETFSIYLISILNAASMFGRILPGFIADRLGHFNILLISMLGSGIVVFCWTAVTNKAGLIVWSLAYGFISGAVLSLQFACTSVLSTRETMGLAMGTVMASIALTALFGVPIAGELVKSGYLALSMFAGATILVGFVFVVGARLKRNRDIMAKV